MADDTYALKIKQSRFLYPDSSAEILLEKALAVVELATVLVYD